MGVTHELRLLSGGANPALAAEIAEHMQTRLADVELKRFADGEIFVKINENIRGRDVFIVQSTNPPAENLLELLLLIDAARRASAHRIAAVVPYFGYARADRKDQPRVAISSKLVANMLTQAGIDRLITIDLHSHQVQGFFDVPLDHLYASPVFLDYFRAKGLKNVAVVAPDRHVLRKWAVPPLQLRRHDPRVHPPKRFGPRLRRGGAVESTARGLVRRLAPRVR